MVASAGCFQLLRGCFRCGEPLEDMPFTCRAESRCVTCRLCVRAVFPGYSRVASLDTKLRKGGGPSLDERSTQVSISVLGVLWGMWQQRSQIGGTTPGRDSGLDGRILRGKGHVDSV